MESTSFRSFAPYFWAAREFDPVFGGWVTQHRTRSKSPPRSRIRSSISPIGLSRPAGGCALLIPRGWWPPPGATRRGKWDRRRPAARRPWPWPAATGRDIRQGRRRLKGDLPRASLEVKEKHTHLHDLGGAPKMNVEEIKLRIEQLVRPELAVPLLFCWNPMDEVSPRIRGRQAGTRSRGGNGLSLPGQSRQGGYLLSLRYRAANTFAVLMP